MFSKRVPYVRSSPQEKNKKRFTLIQLISRAFKISAIKDLYKNETQNFLNNNLAEKVFSKFNKNVLFDPENYETVKFSFLHYFPKSSFIKMNEDKEYLPDPKLLDKESAEDLFKFIAKSADDITEITLIDIIDNEGFIRNDLTEILGWEKIPTIYKLETIKNIVTSFVQTIVLKLLPEISANYRYDQRINASFMATIKVMQTTWVERVVKKLTEYPIFKYKIEITDKFNSLRSVSEVYKHNFKPEKNSELVIAKIHALLKEINDRSPSFFIYALGEMKKECYKQGLAGSKLVELINIHLNLCLKMIKMPPEVLYSISETPQRKTSTEKKSDEKDLTDERKTSIPHPRPSSR